MKIACHPAMFDPHGSDWIVQHRLVAAHGGEPFDVTVKGFAEMTRMLEEGEVLAIATDVPGRTPLTSRAGASSARRGPRGWQWIPGRP